MNQLQLLSKSQRVLHGTRSESWCKRGTTGPTLHQNYRDSPSQQIS
jgi:hypothetical protein